MSNVFGLGDFVGPLPVRASSSDHEEEDILFRMVCRTCWAVGPSALALAVVAALVIDALVPIGSTGLASTMT